MEKYVKNGKECLLCSIREKLIYTTPEEKVRQEFIDVLINDYGVPKSKIYIEFPLSRLKKGAKGRVDLMVTEYIEDKNVELVRMMIECKAPDVLITDKVVNQVYNYSKVLQNKPVLITTNGEETYAYGWKKDTSSYFILSKVPSYTDIIENKSFSFDQVFEYSKWKRPDYREDNTDFLKQGILGEDSSPELASFVTNFIGLLWDVNEGPASIPLREKKFLRNGGVRFTTFGNVSSGSWPGDYSFFILKNENDENEIVSISMMSKMKTKDHPTWGNSKGHTMLLVAIDDLENSHLSLQYAIDTKAEINGDEYTFWHDGTLTVGKKGAVKRQLVIDYIAKKAPDMIVDGKILLGKLENTKMFKWNDKNIIQLFGNLIDYAFYRDEIRNML